MAKERQVKAVKLKVKAVKLKNRTWYTKRLEHIACEFAKERDGYVCRHTGVKVYGSNAHASHIIPKSAGIRFLFDIRNIKCLCMYSHLYWWHKDIKAANRWLEAFMPEFADYTDKIANETLEINTASIAEFYELALKCKDWKEYQELFDGYMKQYIKGAL